jgi:hypothetical protein
MVRSICARRETATAALTIPQTEARNAWSKLNAAKTFPRAITRKQASHAPANFSAAGRANPPVRKSSNASRTLNLRLRIARPFPLGRFFHRRLFSCAIRRRERVMNSRHMGSILVDRWDQASKFLRQSLCMVPHPFAKLSVLFQMRRESRRQVAPADEVEASERWGAPCLRRPLPTFAC